MPLAMHTCSPSTTAQVEHGCSIVVVPPVLNVAVAVLIDLQHALPVAAASHKQHADMELVGTGASQVCQS